MRGFLFKEKKMKKIIILAVVATLCVTAAQAKSVRPGGKKSAQKIDAAVTNGLLAAVENAQREREAANGAVYADNTSARSQAQSGEPVSEAEMCRRMGGFLDACDKGYRPAPRKNAAKPTPKRKPAATPANGRTGQAAPAKPKAQQPAPAPEKEKGFWDMFIESIASQNHVSTAAFK